MSPGHIAEDKTDAASGITLLSAVTPADDHPPTGQADKVSSSVAAAADAALDDVVPAADEMPERSAESQTAVPVQKEAGKRRPGWLLLFALLIFAVLMAVTTGAFKQGKVLPGDVQSKLAEMENIKQDLLRVRQQAEAMQHERDAALAKGRQEQEQRERELKQALDAAQREKEAAAAAALAAEKALRASRQAEELVKKQRIEEARLRAERRRLQQARKEAELVEQRLLEQRRKAELEQQRLESARNRAEALAPQPAADQQKQSPAGLDEVEDSVTGTATDVAEPEARQKETSFNTDPCSSPSAKFLSTCR
jgi:hypothetical protein